MSDHALVEEPSYSDILRNVCADMAVAKDAITKLKALKSGAARFSVPVSCGFIARSDVLDQLLEQAGNVALIDMVGEDVVCTAICDALDNPPANGSANVLASGNGCKIEWISSDELSKKMFEPIKYVVPGIIVEGLTLLASKPKIGKSWLMLHVSIAVASGCFTLGEIKCAEGDVLYLALEDNLRRLKSRMSKLLGQDTPWPKRLYFQTELPLLIAGGIDRIKDWIKAMPNPRMIVIDTLAMVRAPKNKDDSSYDSDYAAVKELRTLANEYNVAIIIVHHTRKAESDDAFDTVSGTLGLTGAPDTILVMRKDASGTVLHGRGRDLMGIEKSLEFNKDACTWTILGDSGEVRTSATRTAILEAMGEFEMTLTEIADATGMTSGSKLKTTLGRMVADGTLIRPKRATYRKASTTGTTEQSWEMD